MKREPILKFVKERLKSDIAFDVVVSLYLAFCLGAGIYLGVVGVTGTCIRAFAFMLFVPFIVFAEWLLRLQITPATCALLLFVPTGSLLGGAGFNVYSSVPFFDTVLHGVSGVVFACVGFALLKAFIGEPNGNKSFFACLFVGFVFSMAIASLWELFEYVAHLVTGLDIEEDTIIHGFQSFLLSGDHNNPEVFKDITETIIYYGNGQEYHINGYLELGLIDTISDMAICCGGAALISVIIAVDWFADKKKYLYRFFIPKYTGGKKPAQPEDTPQNEAPTPV